MTTNGEIRQEDVSAGYGAYHAGFEAGANFVYQQIASSAIKYADGILPQIAALFAHALDSVGAVCETDGKITPIEFEDLDGEHGYTAWRNLHQEVGESPSAAWWSRDDLYPPR